jgi:hypothetical protein
MTIPGIPLDRRALLALGAATAVVSSVAHAKETAMSTAANTLSNDQFWPSNARLAVSPAVWVQLSATLARSLALAAAVRVHSPAPFVRRGPLNAAGYRGCVTSICCVTSIFGEQRWRLSTDRPARCLRPRKS